MGPERIRTARRKRGSVPGEGENPSPGSGRGRDTSPELPRSERGSGNKTPELPRRDSPGIWAAAPAPAGPRKWERFINSSRRDAETPKRARGTSRQNPSRNAAVPLLRRCLERL